VTLSYARGLVLSRTLLLGILVLFPFEAPSAQGAVQHKLRPANARLEAEFTRIVGIRELRDGRVLVADAGEKLLRLVDFAKNTAVQVGRAGRGPGEYATVSPLYPIGPDSTLMPDAGNGRWLVMHNEQIVRAIPPDNPAVRARGAFKGIDRQLRALATTTPQIRDGTQKQGKGDSIPILLIAVASGDVDTVAKLQMAALIMQADLDKSGKITSMNIRVPPLSVGEEALLLPDSWIAIARLDPYRVDWRTPDRRWIRGAALPFLAKPVDARERKAFLERRADASGRSPAAPPDDSWPESIPPFQPWPLLMLPNGNVLILRTPTADHPGHRYDQIDRQGRLVAWLELPATQRIGGIGVQSAYVVVTDDDGIQHLQRHQWP
jgi:hypothetical protein